MAEKQIKTIGVLTSGGDAPGMNAAIRAVVRRGLSSGLNVKGIYKGYNGLLNEEIVDMTARDVSDTIERGGTILYTARCAEFRTPEGQQRGAEICKKHGIDGLVVIGGAEDVLIPEKYDYDEQKLFNNIIASRKAGKKHHIIVNAEGIGHSEAMARRIEAATGIETRATILGHMQRGGNPTCKDRVYASMMGALAVDLLVQGKSCRVVGYRHGEFMDFDINEALAMQKDVSPYMWEVCNSLSHNYKK